MNSPAVLLIDDNRELLFIYEQILIRLTNFHPITSLKGAEGIILAKTQKPALILLDSILEDMPSEEVCRCLKSDPETRQIPVILFSSREMNHLETFAHDIGADDFLQKTPSPTIFVTQLTELAIKFNVIPSGSPPS